MSEPQTPDPPPSAGTESADEQRAPRSRATASCSCSCSSTFVFLASAPTGDWVPLAAAVLQGATLLAALAASDVGPQLWRFAIVVVVAGMVAALGVWIVGLRRRRRGALPAQRAAGRRGTGRDRTLADPSRRRGHPHRHGRAVHLRAARDALGVRLRLDRRVHVGAVLRRSRARQHRGLPLLQLRHADHRRLRRPHRGRGPRPRGRGAGGADRAALPGDRGVASWWRAWPGSPRQIGGRRRGRDEPD